MKKLSWLICLFLIHTGAALAAPPVSGPEGSGLDAFDRLMLDELADNKTPGGALALVKDGRLILVRGYGYADESKGVPATPDTAFGLASVSKTMTAVGILHLVEQGKLRLDDKVYPYLKPLITVAGKVDPRLQKITIRMLLNHSSGFTRAVKVDESQPDVALEEQIKGALTGPLERDPGQEGVYSNFGFNLLGYIASQVSGEDYQSFMRNQVFQPLGLKNVRAPGNESSYANEESHRYAPDGRELPSKLAPSGTPAGGWAASARDMAKFLAALHGPHAYISESIQAEMVAAPEQKSLIRPGGTYFGLGWDKVVRSKNGDGVTTTKNGGLPGVHTEIGHEAGGVDFVLLFNGGEDKVAHETTTKILRLIRQRKTWPQVDYFN